MKKGTIYEKNREERLEYQKKWYKKNNKSRVDYQRKYSKEKKHYSNNKEQYKERSKINYEKNKEKRKKQNLEYYHKMYKNSEGFKMRRLLVTALGSVIRYYIKTGKISNPMSKYHIDWEGVMKVLTPIPKPRSKYNVDHIIPLSRFDLTNFKQIHLAFAPENHRWLKAKDNRKRDRKEVCES